MDKTGEDFGETPIDLFPVILIFCELTRFLLFATDSGLILLLLLLLAVVGNLGRIAALLLRVLLLLLIN